MEIKVGEKYRVNSWGNDIVRIMAKSEGYLMLRYQGCSPFVKSEKEFIEKFKPELITKKTIK